MSAFPADAIPFDALGAEFGHQGEDLAFTGRKDLERIPTPPFWGTRVIRDVPIDEVFDLLDLDELYRLQWGARGSGEAYDNTIKNEFEPALARLKADAKANGWIVPQAVYGYFPVQSDGDDLIGIEPMPAPIGGSRVCPCRDTRSRGATTRRATT